MIHMLLLMTLLGCADPIGHAQPDASLAPGDSGGDAAQTGKVRAIHGADGTYTALVDSSSMTAWTHADLETGMEVDATAAWDLRFQRFHISTNTGVEVAPVAGAFASVTTAPVSGYIADVEGMYAFDQGEGWYDYNGDTHVLTPKPLVWVIKSAGSSTLKLEILKYYDAAGNAGWFTLHWGAL